MCHITKVITKIYILEEIILFSKSCLPEKGENINNTGWPIIWTVPLVVSYGWHPRVSSICYTDFKFSFHRDDQEAIECTLGLFLSSVGGILKAKLLAVTSCECY